MKANNLPGTEFKTLVIKMFSGIRGRVDELSENFNKEIESIKIEVENIKKNQSEQKNAITEMKNTLEGVDSRLDKVKDRINDLEDKVVKNPNQNSNKKEKSTHPKMKIV